MEEMNESRMQKTLCSVLLKPTQTKRSSSSINLSSYALCEYPAIAIRQSFISLHLLSKSFDSLVNLKTFYTAQWNLSEQTEPFLSLQQQWIASFQLAGIVLLVKLIGVVTPYCNLSEMENGTYGFFFYYCLLLRPPEVEGIMFIGLFIPFTQLLLLPFKQQWLARSGLLLLNFHQSL